MNVEQKLVKLSSAGWEYLRQASFLPSHLAEMIESAQRASSGSVSLHVSRQVAEEFRSAFTLHLARVGFDIDYEPTSNGRLLEDLIDRFFVFVDD